MLCRSACKATVRDIDYSSSATGDDGWQGIANKRLNKQTPVKTVKNKIRMERSSREEGKRTITPPSVELLGAYLFIISTTDRQTVPW